MNQGYINRKNLLLFKNYIGSVKKLACMLGIKDTTLSRMMNMVDGIEVDIGSSTLYTIIKGFYNIFAKARQNGETADSFQLEIRAHSNISHANKFIRGFKNRPNVFILSYIADVKKWHLYGITATHEVINGYLKNLADIKFSEDLQINKLINLHTNTKKYNRLLRALISFMQYKVLPIDSVHDIIRPITESLPYGKTFEQHCKPAMCTPLFKVKEISGILLTSDPDSNIYQPRNVSTINFPHPAINYVDQYQRSISWINFARLSSVPFMPCITIDFDLFLRDDPDTRKFVMGLPFFIQMQIASALIIYMDSDHGWFGLYKKVHGHSPFKDENIDVVINKLNFKNAYHYINGFKVFARGNSSLIHMVESNYITPSSASSFIDQSDNKIYANIRRLTSEEELLDQLGYLTEPQYEHCMKTIVNVYHNGEPDSYLNDSIAIREKIVLNIRKSLSKFKEFCYAK